MKKTFRKIGKMNELAWLFGMLFCALGIALCTKAGFGLSMIAAPPYILHIKLSAFFPWFTQGTAEYFWEFVVLLLLCLIVRRIRWQYLLSFGTAVLFGFILDGWLWALGGSALYLSLVSRILAFTAGTLICALGVACFFRTKLPLQVYELAVAEIAGRYRFSVTKTKQGFDGVMLILCLVLSLSLFRGFTGIGIGTVITTAVNAFFIHLWGKLLDRFFTFEPRFRITEKLL